MIACKISAAGDNAMPVAGSLVLVGAVAFVLHFVWEVVQCRLFFVHLELPPTWSGMLGATGGDVVLTFLAYVLVAVGTRDWRWHLRRRWRLSAWLILELAALTLAVAVERMGLEMRRWAYATDVPMLPGFGVSLVPTLQLLLLFPMIFAVAAKLPKLVRRGGVVPSTEA